MHPCDETAHLTYVKTSIQMQQCWSNHSYRQNTEIGPIAKHITSGHVCSTTREKAWAVRYLGPRYIHYWASILHFIILLGLDIKIQNRRSSDIFMCTHSVFNHKLQLTLNPLLCTVHSYGRSGDVKGNFAGLESEGFEDCDISCTVDVLHTWTLLHNMCMHTLLSTRHLGQIAFHQAHTIPCVLQCNDSIEHVKPYFTNQDPAYVVMHS